MEELNNFSNTDINSDTKSFKSLRINNNFKNENISVILDTANEEDINKSVNTVNIINMIGNKGGFKFLKNKEINKQSFSKKNQENEDEKAKIKKDLQINNFNEDVNLTVRKKIIIFLIYK